MHSKEKNRCFGNKPNQTLYAQYHDQEWGIPVYNDQILFEMLTLEGAQAGLSWETILKKRGGYRNAFYNFDITKVSQMSDYDLNMLMENKNIIRHKLKIFSTRHNAHIFMDIQKKHGSFSNFIWHYVDHTPIINHWETPQDVPVRTVLSDTISQDLKQYGMKFTGSKIIYAYLQAIGIIDDHLINCWKRNL